MRLAWLGCLVVAGIALTGCSRLRRHSASERGASEAAKDDRTLANDSAFELIAIPNGATLLWAPRTRSAAALLAQPLGPDGAALSAPAPLVKPAEAPGEISDLAASSGQGELVAVWVERGAGHAQLRAVLRRSGAAARLLELGPAWFAPHPARGNLGVAAQGKATLLFARGESTACVDDASDRCFSFSMRKIEQDQVSGWGFPLIVPTPCADNSLAFAVTGRDLHYGVCTRSSGKPVTTLFTIRAEPEYARADPILPGCRPLAVVELDGAVRLIADCDGQRRAARVGPDNSPVQIEDLPSPGLECQGERAKIRVGEAWIELDRARAQLHALLPSVIAPRGSRAVFTGAALVVAQAKGGKLELSRYACRAGILRQLRSAAR